jgi:hypothetical protein
MAVWHAQLDTHAIEAGSRVSVLSDHHRVRVRTADQMWIESPDGQRIVALVTDRSGDRMKLSAPGGASYGMSALPDAPEAAARAPFSHELWLVN